MSIILGFWKRLVQSRIWRGIARHRGMAISVFIIVAHILGAITSVRAIMQARTSQGAIAWAISLNTYPYVTVPAYWVFGRHKFQDYAMERQEAFEATNPVAQLIHTRYVGAGLRSVPEMRSGHLLEKLARLPFTGFNQVDLLIDGKQTYGALLDAIDRARHYVLVQFYIVRDDGAGRALRDRLLACAKRGVRVYFLYDEIGSTKLPRGYLRSLTEGGVLVGPFNSTQGKANRFQFNFRNHRKVVVVDGRVAFIGGLNMGDEYLGKSAKFGPWRDTHVRIAGPAVELAQLSFTEDWRWATGQIPELSWEPIKSPSGTQHVLCLPSGPADPRETCALFFLSTINNSEKRLWIASPYFIPDEQIMSALELAALRGVDVRILIPRNYDWLLMRLAMLSFLSRADRAGIKMLQYNEGFMHQKVLLADNHLAAIGTANFDNRSFRLNFEITAVVWDARFNTEVASMLRKDMARSSSLSAADFSERAFPFRFAARLAGLFAPVL